MVQTFHLRAQWALPILIGVCLLAFLCALLVTKPASAITALPTPPPQPGSYGLAATKTQPAPVTGATITTPGTGGSFTTSPITITGICPDDLLVQLYDNNVMVGSVVCTNGSFSLQVSLFAGVNELSAVVYDELDQNGPTSNTITVTYTDSRLTAFGALITLTSSYGRRAAATGAELSWPLQLSGGTGPYAFSIDWGDASTSELKSQSLSGLVTIGHAFKKAGVYTLNVRVTDSNGVSAFLQVVSVASGKVDSTPTDTTTGSTTVTQVIWIPAVFAVLLLVPTYWLGRRSQLVSIRNKMLKERDNYEKK